MCRINSNSILTKTMRLFYTLGESGISGSENTSNEWRESVFYEEYNKLEV